MSTTEESVPETALFSSHVGIAAGTGAALFLLNVLLMFALAETSVPDLVFGLFGLEIAGLPVGLLVGVAVFGGALTVGRSLGLGGLENGVTPGALAGVGLVEVTYGAYGAALLSVLPVGFRAVAAGLAGAGTAVITVVCVALVFATDLSFGWAERVGGAVLAAGVVVSMGGGVLGSLLVSIVGTVIVVVGFSLDLLYEIERTAVRGRSPLGNGFGVYFAAMGVFVHLLQLIIRLLSRE